MTSSGKVQSSKFQGKSRLQEQQQRQMKAEEKKGRDEEEDDEPPPGLTRLDSSSGIPRLDSSVGVSRDVARAMEKKQVKQHPDARHTQILKAIKESEESPDSKTHVNLVVIGHVDAGKSTLMGHLLLQWYQIAFQRLINTLADTSLKKQ
jgi:predicted GTPase